MTPAPHPDDLADEILPLPPTDPVHDEAIARCRQALGAAAAPPPPTAVALSFARVDLPAVDRLGLGFCALYGLLPLTQAPADRADRRQELPVAAAFPVHPLVRGRLQAWLERPVTLLAADALEVDAVLAMLQARRTPSGPGAQEPRPRTLEVIDALEDDGVLEALGAAEARASALGLATRARDAAPIDWPLLPPGPAGRSAIQVRSIADRQLVLVTDRPSPRLHRAVSAIHPGWAIAWEVALP